MSKQPYYEQQGVAMTSRSYEEYQAMFSLDESHLTGPILDVAGGASSFAAVARSKGMNVISTDPLYASSPEKLKQIGLEEIAQASRKLEKVKSYLNWEFYGSLDNHQVQRRDSFSMFITDFSLPSSQSYYVPAQLPTLPFQSGQFQYVLCSHFLFLYDQQFDVDFHLASVKEMLRVLSSGGELCIYPLVNLQFEVSHVLPLLLQYCHHHPSVAYQLVSSELNFLPKATQFLRIIKKAS